jgi:hypothetical protein
MKKNDLLLILFWGSLWGIAEATIGLALHIAAIALPGLPGFLMFPVAFYFMKKVFDATGKTSSVFYVSVLAALIKLSDFLLPVSMAIRIINPALSILLEGLAVSLVLRFFPIKKTIPAAFLQPFSMAVIWRALFLAYLFIISLYGLPAALVTDGIVTSLRFLLLESFINCLLMGSWLLWGKTSPKHPSSQIRPIYSYALLVLAIGLQLIL